MSGGGGGVFRLLGSPNSVLLPALSRCITHITLSMISDRRDYRISEVVVGRALGLFVWKVHTCVCGEGEGGGCLGVLFHGDGFLPAGL